LFPDDITANVNAASAALARKDVPSAQRYLSKVKGRTGSAEYYNAAGVLQMLRGNYDEAEILLDKASVMGLAAAKQNKEELTRKRANSYEIESINRENR
ncbi:MAG: cell envelope biogenesis protein OmpA, partial [Bacteroides sp.]